MADGESPGQQSTPMVDRRWSCVIGAPTAVRRLSASIHSTSHNACGPSPFVANYRERNVPFRVLGCDGRDWWFM